MKRNLKFICSIFCVNFVGVCYQEAKQALNTALPKKLFCREKQYNDVSSFLDRCLQKQVPGSMYISGAPGTGKTAVMSTIIKKLQVRRFKMHVRWDFLTRSFCKF